MKRSFVIINFVAFLLTAAMASSLAFAQRPGGPPPGRGPQGDGRRGGPPDGPPRPGDLQGPPPDHRPGPFGPQADLLSSEMRFGDRLVKGVPYSAHFTSETVQILGDGTRIVRKSDGSVWRSTEGRTRREQTLAAIGPIPIQGVAPRMIFINDPVAGLHYVVDVNRKTFRRLPYRDNPPGPPLPSDFRDNGDPVKTESLGKQTIEGVEAEGTRSTITIPAGRVGNDRPLEIVSERWFSPELQVVVLSKHKDPFAGETTYKLTNISREEPAASNFEVPSDYSLEEGPPPDDGPRRPKPPRPE